MGRVGKSGALPTVMPGGHEYMPTLPNYQTQSAGGHILGGQVRIKARRLAVAEYRRRVYQRQPGIPRAGQEESGAGRERPARYPAGLEVQGFVGDSLAPGFRATGGRLVSALRYVWNKPNAHRTGLWTGQPMPQIPAHAYHDSGIVKNP